MAERPTAYNTTPVVENDNPVSVVYEESIQDLDGLPQTTQVPELQLHPNIPNIFRVPSEGLPEVWIKHTEATPLYLVVIKADVGGVGGHVVVADKVQGVGLDHVLRYNRIDSTPIFTSIFATHTGDDLAFTGVVTEDILEHHREAMEEIIWDAFVKGADVAAELGNYGPGQDLKKDSFTGNISGSGPASINLPLPRRNDPTNTSQSVLVMYADKTEPGAYNPISAGAFLDANFNTGLLIAESAMKRGYVFEITDVDTKAQAIEAGASPSNPEEMDEMMEKLGAQERSVQLKSPEDTQDIQALLMSGSRYVVSKIFSRDENGEADQQGLAVSAERLHNIKTEKGFTYGGKDDPVLATLAQGDWPAPGETTSPLARAIWVSGDCRGSHMMPWYPMPINEQTSFWSGPIVSGITVSINLKSGQIGAISDQLSRGTPWDEFRQQQARRMEEFRAGNGYRQPATLPTDEIEYQPGYEERVKRLRGEFKVSAA